MKNWILKEKGNVTWYLIILYDMKNEICYSGLCCCVGFLYIFFPFLRKWKRENKKLNSRFIIAVNFNAFLYFPQ